MTPAEGSDTATDAGVIRLPIYSASQIETFDESVGGCPRKWGFDKIDRIPRASTKAADLGTLVHGQLERHLRGEGFDFTEHRPGLTDHPGHAAELASLAVPHLPAPMSDGIEVERSFTREAASGRHRWTGRIDLRVVLDRVKVYDHKTSGNLAYAKTPEVLRRDAQANLYAWDSFKEFPVPEVDLQWTYIPTRGGKHAVPMTLTVRRSEVEDRIGEIDLIADRITVLRSQVSSARELPYNPDACDKYGGCPYQSKCNLSPRERLRGMSSATLPPFGAKPLMSTAPAISLFDQLRRAGGNAAPAIVNAPAPTTAPPVTTPATPSALNAPPTVAAAPRVAFAPPGKTPPPPAVTGPVNPPESAFAPTTLPAPTGTPTAAVAMPATPPPAPPVSGPPAEDKPKRRGRPTNAERAAKAAAAAGGPVNIALRAETHTSTPAHMLDRPEYAVPGDGSEEGAAMSDAIDAATPTLTVARTEPGQVTHVTTNVHVAAEAMHPGEIARAVGEAMDKIDATRAAERPLPHAVLFINCRPIRGEFGNVIELDDLVLAANAKIQAEHGIDDYSLIDYKGAGVLSVLVCEAAYAAAFTGRRSAIVVDTRTREASIVLAKLTAMCGAVVRGV